MTDRAMIIHGDMLSGNCLKVKYVADHLSLPYRWVAYDVTRGETRTPAYLAKFPLGQVPAVELPDGRRLQQSNAIMRFLARGSSLLPDDPFVQAKIDEMLFWEQNSHEFFVAGCRFQRLYLGKRQDELEPWRVARGNAALDHMETLLRGRRHFVGDELTIADIALLAYTRLAHEGGFDLAGRPMVVAWIARCENLLGLPSTG